MNNTIKGITIEIGGDTGKLGKALQNVEKQSKSLSAELGQINRLLKLDPGNTELLAQKQNVLAEAVAAARSAAADCIRQPGEFFSPRTCGARPHAEIQPLICSLVSSPNPALSALLSVFRRWAKAARITRKSIASSCTSTGGLSSTSSFTTADVTFGAGRKHSLGTSKRYSQWA